MSSLVRRIFGIGEANVRFDQRGFYAGQPETRQRLEHVGATFLTGYHAALDHPHAERIAESLERVQVADRGFAYEGAAMALAIRDRVLPASSRLRSLMDGPGKPHIYMLHVGAGWALARLPVPINRAIQSFDPLLRWLVVDGFGFHSGYFHWRAGKPPKAPRSLSREGLHAFDQGLGRALWFQQCGDPERIARTVGAFAESRRRDLWGGVGLAATYAGGVSQLVLRQLAAISDHPAALAQGAVFASNARELAANPAPETELACSIFCDMAPKLAAQIADQALAQLHSEATEPRYQDWVMLVEARFKKSSNTQISGKRHQVAQ